jgi:hypothetical protein
VAGRPLARPRVAAEAGAERRAVHAVLPFLAVLAFRVAPVVVRPVPAVRLAAGRPGAVAVRAAAVLRFVHVVHPCHVARPFRVAPVTPRWVPAARLAVERSERRVAAVVAAVRQLVHVVRIFHVALVAARWALAERLVAQR